MIIQVQNLRSIRWSPVWLSVESMDRATGQSMGGASSLMLPLIELRRLQREGLRDGKIYRQLLEELLQGGDLEEVQSSLLEVFHDKLLKQFRPLPTARKSFAKSVLMALEDLEEANDELFELCTKEVLLPVEDSGLVGHKIFELQEGYVVVRVADQIGGGLETGCMIWTGGCMLLGLALAGALDHLLHGHILELGAGTGFLGLALGLQGRPVTLSDNQLQVLENLRYNLDATRKCNEVELKVDICRLDWCEPDNVPKVDVADVLLRGLCYRDPVARKAEPLKITSFRSENLKLSSSFTWLIASA
eukprot:s840_g7.t2